MTAGHCMGVQPTDGGPRMNGRASITINRPREEVERLWQTSEYRPGHIDDVDVEVSFREAPGDRGAEIHVLVKDRLPGGKVGKAVGIVTGTDPLARVKDDLRRFKQHVETGVIVRSEGAPEGELAGRKLKQRPAHPLNESELDKAGV
jgi:uncharacterized membrane protein